MIHIDIETEASLTTFEKVFSRIGKLSIRHDVTVRLSRNLHWDFMRESRLASLLATIAAHHDLTVCDWYDRWNDDDIEKHFRTSLVGVAAVFHAHQITNIGGQEFPGHRNAFLEQIGIAGGLLEPRLTGRRGKSITFCAFDPEWGEPAALAGTLNRRELFMRTFEKYRLFYLKVGEGLTHTALTREADQRLAGFVFELYQNTYEHGRRLGSDSAPLPGMRYVRLRKYIDRKANFLARAEHFEEMRQYLQSVVFGDDFRFYEISVADDGPGMINHLLQTRSDLRPPKSGEDRIALVNELLTTALTSKRDYPGAGRGLPNVLKAITELRGFVSLRTDRVWLCGHSQDEEHPLEKTGLRPVNCREQIGPIVGTQFNIVLPLPRG